MLLFILLVGLGLWLFSAQLLTLAGSALVENDGPQKSDAIVVLGGDEYGQRVLKASELAKEGYAPVVDVSGPPGLLGPDSDTEIEFAERHGYPASYFHSLPLADGAADSTRSEARFLGKYLHSLSVKKILLVTSNYHTARAARLWRIENPWLDVDVVPAPDRNFTPSTWWKTRQGQKTFVLEWTKTLAAALGD